MAAQELYIIWQSLPAGDGHSALAVPLDGARQAGPLVARDGGRHVGQGKRKQRIKTIWEEMNAKLLKYVHYCMYQRSGLRF